jgi:hypothetical protein
MTLPLLPNIKEWTLKAGEIGDLIPNIFRHSNQFCLCYSLGNVGSKINRDYKDGEDIRPLKPTGEQNQRFAQLKFQEEEAKKIKAASDTIYKRSVQDFAHWTSATVDADPLWLLYYKRMLKPITEFPILHKIL